MFKKNTNSNSPLNNNLSEFTTKALVIGLVLSVFLGAANAYLGLKAGMTIAATYPAAVISMAIIRALKGNLLEENFGRTVGSVGESIAAGAIFTLPAFFIAGVWNPFYTATNYFTATLILITGGVLGIIFVAMLRRIMVEDKELPYPESVAAAEIHLAGQQGGKAATYLFWGMAIGALVKILAELKLFAASFEKFIVFAKQTVTGTNLTGKGGIMFIAPGISPAYLGVGYIIGPKLGKWNFAGSVIAWCLLIPLILLFLSPSLNITQAAAALMAHNPSLTASEALNSTYISTSFQIWRFIIRPIAIGGMLVGAAYTLFKMRKSFTAGLKRSFADVKKATAKSNTETPRTEKDLSLKTIAIIMLAVALLTFSILFFLIKTSLLIAIVSATVMLLLAFFFAAIAGYLVGVIGSSNNPVSGLTLSAVIIIALMLLVFGTTGVGGLAAVLAAAAIVCVSASVAGEMLQDLKAGHILGGTPWKMEVGNIISVVVSAVVMFGVLIFLNNGDIAKGVHEGYQGGFGSKNLAAPQANMMAIISKGIINGSMMWPLIIIGIFFGLALLLMGVTSPMLICVGMYLPFETTFAIFIGSLFKGFVDNYAQNKGFTEHRKTLIENVGILTASGLIAGEALMGLVIAMFAAANIFLYDKFSFFTNPPFAISMVVLVILAWYMIRVPVKARE